jgi:16S rRNA (uracil1498-N3)-methyltransferase
VTVHRLFIAPEQLAAGARVRLKPSQSRHLLTVLRLQPGAEVEVFDGQGGRFSAVVTGDDLEIGAALPRDARRVDVVLVQAVAKGEKMDLVVQKATELGAARIFPLAAERAVVRLEGGRGPARADRWRRIAQEAARQCGRADVPQVDAPATWDGVFALLQADRDRHALLLDPADDAVRLGDAVESPDRSSPSGLKAAFHLPSGSAQSRADSFR